MDSEDKMSTTTMDELEDPPSENAESSGEGEARVEYRVGVRG